LVYEFAKENVYCGFGVAFTSFVFLGSGDSPTLVHSRELLGGKCLEQTVLKSMSPRYFIWTIAWIMADISQSESG